MESIVGVPDNSPVAVSKWRPFGTPGEILHEVAAPPLLDGVTEDIASSTIKSKVVVE